MTILAAFAMFMVACADKPDRISDELQRRIELGQKVFEAKECGKCHETNGEFVESEDTGPDLSSVFLAMDTMFVKSHLQFTEVSAMPPIELTPHEISALTQYIGVLHAKANMDPNLENPDGVCPICGAPLNKAEAEANHLKVNYAGKDYYFECPDCKVVFQRDPAWYSQSGYLETKRGVRTYLE